jgi:hypothetical protein
LGAIGLALIPPTLVESIWVSLMDEYTPDGYDTATQFFVNRRPRTNNHVEGYNRRMKAEFPLHPHIYQFIDILRNEHEYQHHVAEESQIQLKRRKKIYDEIDLKLAMLHEEHKKKQLSDIQLAIKCGRAVKTRLFKV